MCLAIANAGKVITKDIFVTADQYNSDGMGMLWLNRKGHLDSYRHMGDVSDFYDHYLRVRMSNDASSAQEDSTILIHFRMATHGTKNLSNCHPFMVSKSVGFIHNGVFSSVPSDVKYSDTQMFNKLVLQKLPRNFMENDAIMELMDHYCGSFNKLCFLNTKGEVKIVNEDRGTWEDGNWYSNSTGFPTWGSLGIDTGYKSGVSSHYRKGWKWDYKTGMYVAPKGSQKEWEEVDETDRYQAYWAERERKRDEQDEWDRATQLLDGNKENVPTSGFAIGDKVLCKLAGEGWLRVGGIKNPDGDRKYCLNYEDGGFIEWIAESDLMPYRESEEAVEEPPVPSDCDGMCG